MCLLDAVVNTLMLGQITVSHSDRSVGILSLEAVVHLPAYDGHERRVAERTALSPQLQFDFSMVIGLVTGLTERNEVVRTVATCLSAFDMVYVQDLSLIHI